GAGLVHPAVGAGAGEFLGGGGALLTRQPFGHAGRAGDGQGAALSRGRTCAAIVAAPPAPTFRARAKPP
ncbi:MAG: hypothetical protein Q7S85_01980, partial [Rugosibacter sp.]|nr:hypothetical protein [Rugosibacter sp.]